MWCVVADNGDEFWVYGVFINKKEAEKYAETSQNHHPGIEYTVSQFIGGSSNADDPIPQHNG